MTGSRLPYLERRQGMWNLRVRVPDGIKLRVGMCEVWRSLRTYSPERARLLAAPLVARLQEIFRMALTNSVTKDEVRMLVDKCFVGLSAETERIALTFVDPAREVHEQRRMVDERLHELRTQVRCGSFDPDVHATASELLHRHGFDPESLTAGVKQDLLEGVARALAEQQRLFEFRLGDRLRQYEPEDGTFAGQPLAAAVRPLKASLDQAEVYGPTIQEAIDRYLKVKRKSWATKTLANRARQLNLLVQHLGCERRLITVKRADILAFRDGVERFRRDHHVGASLSFTGRQIENEALRIGARTAQMHVENVGSFLRWATREGYVADNPAKDVTVELPKKAKSHEDRRPPSLSELETLFSAPLFTGCQSAHRRHAKGPTVIKDAEYWLPYLGYYTGARMAELVQLHIADVFLDGPTPFIFITDQGGGDEGSDTAKSLKTPASLRRVPLHPHLMDLGFSAFVEKRRADKRHWVRLFYEIPFGKEQASAPYSKRFARVLDKAGLTDPALCFHSFRHGVEDALKAMRKFYCG